MRTIKTSILTVLAAIVILCAVNTTSYSTETQKVTISNDIKKPGPRYVWVSGHYKHNKFGKLLWIPGHWKRV